MKGRLCRTLWHDASPQFRDIWSKFPPGGDGGGGVETLNTTRKSTRRRAGLRTRAPNILTSSSTNTPGTCFLSGSRQIRPQLGKVGSTLTKRWTELTNAGQSLTKDDTDCPDVGRIGLPACGGYSKNTPRSISRVINAHMPAGKFSQIMANVGQCWSHNLARFSQMCPIFDQTLQNIGRIRRPTC